MNIYEACPEVENGSFLLYIPHINDRLAHRPQMVCGWIRRLAPRTCEGGVPSLAQGRGEYEFPVIASQFANWRGNLHL